ncbi:MAG TPA: alpha-glucosidase/alpha-galactosidase, partial [Dictyoglomaceae bacterium]|nr:alpha-glucosidase/alpha-galactosidase [Dictyoglomaceae bacterium]
MKIAIVGAGSFRFALQLIGDIAKTPSLNGSLIALMDVNEERLNATYILAKKYMEELGSALKFEKTTNLEKALEGADFVINTALPYPQGHEDGFKKYEIITEIAEKYGYYRGIDSQELNMVSTYSY